MYAYACASSSEYTFTLLAALNLYELIRNVRNAEREQFVSKLINCFIRSNRVVKRHNNYKFLSGVPINVTDDCLNVLFVRGYTDILSINDNGQLRL